MTFLPLTTELFINFKRFSVKSILKYCKHKISVSLITKSTLSRLTTLFTSYLILLESFQILLEVKLLSFNTKFLHFRDNIFNMFTF